MIQVRFALTYWDQASEGLGLQRPWYVHATSGWFIIPMTVGAQGPRAIRLQFRLTVFSGTYSRKMLNQSFGKLCLWVNLLIKYLGEKYLFRSI